MTERDQHNVSKEADIVAGIDHKNIVCVIGSFFFQNIFYVVLELASGGDLRNQITTQRRKKEPWPKSFIANWLGQLLCGLECLHGMRILHRDIKSANILVELSGPGESSVPILKFTDFGMAKDFVTGDDYLASTVCGTRLYMSPEALAGAKYSFDADMWSLGAVFYEIWYSIYL